MKIDIEPSNTIMKTRLVKQAILFQLLHLVVYGDEKLESDHPYPFDHTNQDYTQPAGMLNLGLGYIFDHSFGSGARRPITSSLIFFCQNP